MKGVICSGAVIHDTLVRPVEEPEWGTTTIVETIAEHAGGNAANTSIALATLGVLAALPPACSAIVSTIVVVPHSGSSTGRTSVS